MVIRGYPRITMEDLVTCLICGHQAVTLARHLKASHGVTADVYRAQNPGARIRSESCEANRKASISKSHKDKPRSGLKKTITCPSCKRNREVGLTFAPSVHDARCPDCRALEKTSQANDRWSSKIESEDYVVCIKCGHRAENLTSHIQNAHPEWIGVYPSQIVASNSAVRDKTALRGRVLSAEVKAKMAASAGWNRGLTKHTDSRVANAAAAMKGRSAWSKGLTKETHPGLQTTSRKLSAFKTGVPNDAARLDLSLVDFTPYLDETGAVDRVQMAEVLGVCEPTVTKYMVALGLRLSTKYVDARISKDCQSGKFVEMAHRAADQNTVRLTVDQLNAYRLKSGKVCIGKAMVGLGHTFAIIKRECDRLGIPTHTRLIRQGLCLEAISRALGDVEFEQEWRSRKFLTEKGNFYRFDGYYPSLNLIVEFHGYQHWTFPSVYIRDEAVYLALQERDRVKEELIQNDPVLRYFLVREDEPYTDVEYLRSRLIEEGLLNPGK